MLPDACLEQARKKKKVSQDELVKAIGVYTPAIGRYERGVVKPSIEATAKKVEVLKVLLDYLIGLVDYEPNNNLTQKILYIQKLDNEDKNSILKTIDPLLRDAKKRKIYAS